MEALKLTLDRNCIIALERFAKGRTRGKHGKERNEGQKRDEANATAVRRLNEFQKAKVITLFIPHVNMLENQPEDEEENHSEYRVYLKHIGLDVEASSIFKAADRLVLQQGDTLDFSLDRGMEELFHRRFQNTLFPCEAFDFSGHLECYCKRTGIEPKLLADVISYLETANPEILFPYKPQRMEEVKKAIEEESGRSLKEAAKRCQDEWMNRACDVETLYTHFTWQGAILVTDDDNFRSKWHLLSRFGMLGKVMTPLPLGTVQHLEKHYPLCDN